MSASLTSAKDKTFFAGWLHALHDILIVAPTTGFISIPNMGHNDSIIDNLKWKYKPYSTHDAAYYLYNYVCPGMTLQPQRCWISL